MPADYLDYLVEESEQIDDGIMVLVTESSTDDWTYSGINVLLREDGTYEGLTADPIAEDQWSNGKEAILKVAFEHLLLESSDYPLTPDQMNTVLENV